MGKSNGIELPRHLFFRRRKNPGIRKGQGKTEGRETLWEERNENRVYVSSPSLSEARSKDIDKAGSGSVLSDEEYKECVDVLGNIIVVNYIEINALLEKVWKPHKMANNVYQASLVCERTKFILAFSNFSAL